MKMPDKFQHRCPLCQRLIPVSVTVGKPRREDGAMVMPLEIDEAPILIHARSHRLGWHSDSIHLTGTELRG